MKNQVLAELIRQGLAVPGIVEDQEIFGAGTYGGAIHANTVGFALIGKVGVERAVALFEQAISELDPDAPANKEIFDQLGVGQAVTEEMVVRHWSGVSAAEIANELETGTFMI